MHKILCITFRFLFPPCHCRTCRYIFHATYGLAHIFHSFLAVFIFCNALWENSLVQFDFNLYYVIFSICSVFKIWLFLISRISICYVSIEAFSYISKDINYLIWNFLFLCVLSYLLSLAPLFQGVDFPQVFIDFCLVTPIFIWNSPFAYW